MSTRMWTAGAILDAFQRFEQEMGRPPTVGDANFTAPAWQRSMKPARIAEAQRARDLGLRLPDTSATKREFGSWTAALAAAGMEPPPRGSKQSARTEKVCPSCGDFTWSLYETGWCGPCTSLRGEAA